MTVGLRAITPGDHDAVLAWNAADVEWLAPLDRPALQALVAMSDTAAVITYDGDDAGFVITFADNTGYSSPNYRWFAERHDEFVYLDRIVVDPAFRRRGVAVEVYEMLEAAAATHCEVFCVEVNLEPRNDASLAFHAARGFSPVGEQSAGGHLVALLEKPLHPLADVVPGRLTR